MFISYTSDKSFISINIKKKTENPELSNQKNEQHRHFSKRNTNDKTHMTRDILSHLAEVNQTTERFHLTSVRMSVIEKTKTNKRWRGQRAHPSTLMVGELAR